jgi:general secretion pathway protein D
VRQLIRANGFAWRLGLVLALAMIGGDVRAQQAPTGQPGVVVEDDKVQLDFNDVEISVVIDTIARLTNKNFIYDDRVRGRVTIVSPTTITVDEAYAVFESVLQVKGFTTVTGPGGAIKVIPVREAKESNIETMRGLRTLPDSDRTITRLIPLQYIDAEAITNTLKPLVSKDASMVAYPPTNTVILTDAASNIRRILTILQSIDVETYKEELTVIKVRHADASTLAEQLSEIFGAEVAAAAPASRARTRRAAAAAAAAEGAAKGKVRILTDDRTNSLIILASRQRLEELRGAIARLDVPVTGQGRIHVYYLKHADAEELATTLSSLISGQPAGGGGGPGAQAAQPAMRAAITELAEGVTVTADAPTNSLVIQASKEGFGTLSEVIAQLDIPRPQVLVEALLMEVDVSDGHDLGFTGLATIYRGDTSYVLGSVSDPVGRARLIPPEGGSGETDPDTGEPIAGDSVGDTVGNIVGILADQAIASFIGGAVVDTRTFDEAGNVISGSFISGLIRASANLGNTNILSAPHVLTSDNEEAEIKVGANIPIVTSRVQSAGGITQAGDRLATSQNIERQDIGITLRVTPQISEGDTVRLEIFQEITTPNLALSSVTGDPQEVGISLSNRQVENTVVVSDGDTVVIGGLISDRYEDSVNKVPWLGDIPGLGWLFKTTSKDLTKENLLIFLTPHIMRSAVDLEQATIRKRAEFWDQSEEALQLSDREKEMHRKRREEALAAGIDFVPAESRNPVRAQLEAHARKYPVERMREIEQAEQAEAEAERRAALAAETAPSFGVLAATFRNESAATDSLQQLIDAGYDGALVSGDTNGTVLYEVQLGPYPSIEAAREVAGVIRETFGLAPIVVVETESE